MTFAPRTATKEIHPDYVSALQDAGLTEYQEIMDYFSDDIAAQSRTSSTVRVKLQRQGQEETVYLKRYWYPKPVWKYSVRSSRAAIENKNLKWMQSHNLSAPQVIAWGELRSQISLLGCYIMTAAVPESVNLDEYFSQPEKQSHSSSTLQKRRAAIRLLAGYVAQMHSYGYVDHDLFFRNVLLTHDEAGHYEFHFIDSPKGGISSGFRLRRGMAYDLASLNKTAAEHLSVTNRLRFMHAYLGTTKLSKIDLARMLEIGRLSAKMRRKSKAKRQLEAAR